MEFEVWDLEFETWDWKFEIWNWEFDVETLSLCCCVLLLKFGTLHDWSCCNLGFGAFWIVVFFGHGVTWTILVAHEFWQCWQFVMLLNELWLEFWGVEVVVENFVDMCKFYFMNIAQFCGYAYGKLLWVWQFYGYEILAIKKKKIFVGYVMLDHGQLLWLWSWTCRNFWLWFWSCRNFWLWFWTCRNFLVVILEHEEILCCDFGLKIWNFLVVILGLKIRIFLVVILGHVDFFFFFGLWLWCWFKLFFAEP